MTDPQNADIARLDGAIEAIEEAFGSFEKEFASTKTDVRGLIADTKQMNDAMFASKDSVMARLAVIEDGLDRRDAALQHEMSEVREKCERFFRTVLSQRADPSRPSSGRREERGAESVHGRDDRSRDKEKEHALVRLTDKSVSVNWRRIGSMWPQFTVAFWWIWKAVVHFFGGGH